MILIYITCQSVEQAKQIGRHLLEKRLCACVNIFDHMMPMYWWPPKEGKISEDSEVVLLIKTLEEKFDEIERQVKKLHTDSTPCIFSIKVDRVSKQYYEWIKGEII